MKQKIVVLSEGVQQRDIVNAGCCSGALARIKTEA
jgi:hypothetical protein